MADMMFNVTAVTEGNDESYLIKFTSPTVTKKGMGQSNFVKKGRTVYYWCDYAFEVGEEVTFDLNDYDEIKKEFTLPDTGEVIELTYIEPK